MKQPAGAKRETSREKEKQERKEQKSIRETKRKKGKKEKGEVTSRGIKNTEGRRGLCGWGHEENRALHQRRNRC
jgi:hypothetical protein